MQGTVREPRGRGTLAVESGYRETTSEDVTVNTRERESARGWGVCVRVRVRVRVRAVSYNTTLQNEP
jgi:hypothetical protein